MKKSIIYVYKYIYLHEVGKKKYYMIYDILIFLSDEYVDIKRQYSMR